MLKVTNASQSRTIEQLKEVVKSGKHDVALVREQLQHQKLLFDQELYVHCKHLLLPVLAHTHTHTHTLSLSLSLSLSLYGTWRFTCRIEYAEKFEGITQDARTVKSFYESSAAALEIQRLQQLLSTPSVSAPAMSPDTQSPTASSDSSTIACPTPDVCMPGLPCTTEQWLTTRD
jgi:hypothetical protein